jgi:hypothetical protein
MKLPGAIFLIALMLPVSIAAEQKNSTKEPIAWGAISQNTGCVIFQEGHKTNGKFWGVAVTTKTYGLLTVIETKNYTMEEKQILETQENIDTLTQRAVKDRVKFVKIPEKYSPELLEKARALCKQDQ